MNYYKVPKYIWTVLKNARNACDIKNYNSKLTTKTLKIRNNNNIIKYAETKYKILEYLSK